MNQNEGCQATCQWGGEWKMIKNTREPIYFVTHHQKHLILENLFQNSGLSLVGVDADTDSLGTFSGEKPRLGGIKDALRGKIELGKKLIPEAKFILSSEGSFGPHPFMGFVPSDLECLMLLDVENQIEHYIEHLSLEVQNKEVETSSFESECLQNFLKDIKFPTHRLIVRPQNSFELIFKGVRSEEALREAIDKCLNHEPNNVLVQVDLRAHMNPTRAKVIFEAGTKLVELINSRCPSCGYFGYSISKTIHGLPCEACGEPSGATKNVQYECKKCSFNEIKTRPDGVTKLEARFCEFCNP
jgi:hypothetical protein